MSKIARPAVAAGINFTKEHWNDIGIVYLKLIPVYLVVFGINMGVTLLMGPPTTMMHHIIINGTALLAYAGEMLFVLPVTVACFRTALLNEPFDRSIYSRVFNVRELTFFRWYVVMMAIAIVPILAVLSAIGLLDMSLDNPATFSPMVSIALGIAAIICFYFMFRLFYVMPAIATDKPMSFPLMWEMSRNKAWPIFKMSALVTVILMLTFGVIGGVGFGLSTIITAWNPVIIGIFAILGLIVLIAMVIFMVGTSLGAVAHIYKTLEK